MKVFISWSGETSREVAETFRSWLPSVIQIIKPYVSSEDIQKGANWSTNIACQLDDSNYGIICLTKENVAAPWVHFEAGALGKCFSNARVSPFLFHINQSDVQGPLTQFQSTKFSSKDIFRLLSSINEACGEEKLDNTILTECFSVWWPKLEEKLNSIKPISTPDITKKVSKEVETNKVLEEVLDAVRTSLRMLGDPEKLLPKEYLKEIIFNSEYKSMERQKRIHSMDIAIKKIYWFYMQIQKLVDANVQDPQKSFFSEIVSDFDGTTKSLNKNLVVEIGRSEDWHKELLILVEQLRRPVRELMEKSSLY